jgi:transcriptional regulator GlxA family with amidase domain
VPSRDAAELQRLHALASLLVARHYRRPLTVTGVADAVGASPRRLQRAYSHAGEGSFREHLAQTRLAAAAELLAGQSIPVELVGRLVGYREPSAFARAFRRRYGLTPARYRAAARTARAATLSSPTTAATTPGS